jgi:hypothetical protein
VNTDDLIFWAAWFAVGILSAFVVRVSVGHAARNRKWEWVFYTVLILFGPPILLTIIFMPWKWIRNFDRG